MNRYDRNEMFDFIPIVVDGLCLTMYPQPPEYDIGTFIRPFRQSRYLRYDPNTLTYYTFK